MHDNTVTFADVELVMESLFGSIRGKPYPEKAVKTITGIRDHTYYIILPDKADRDDDYVEKKVSKLQSRFSDISISVISTNEDGIFLRVGNLPVSESLASEALDRMLSEEEE